ncbi:MAG: MFS transporter [Candidatus Thorarchaeota archaeon]|nr:MFS transporter [Candidatus Thorarchaeota archaeon]
MSEDKSETRREEDREVSSEADQTQATPDHDPVRAFGAASFLNDTGSDMISAVWPNYLKTYLGLPFVFVLAIDGLAQTVTALAKVSAGYASDRTGRRKPFIIAGYSMASISRLGFALSTVFSPGLFQAAALKTMDRLGKIRGPPRDAIVADCAEKRHRGRSFGFLRAMDTAGALFGSILAVLLFGTLGYAGIFLLATIPSLFSVLIVLRFIRDKRGRDVFKGISFRNLDKNLKILLLASLLLAMATYSYSFIILFAGGLGWDEAQAPLLYVLFNLVYAGSALPFGAASDKYGRKSILLTAAVLLVLTSLWSNVATNMLMVLPMLVFFGLVNGALDPVQTTFVADLVEPERRGTIIGGFQMAIGLAALPGGVIIGYIADAYSLVTAFHYSVVLTMAAIVLLLLVRSQKVERTTPA